MSGGERLNVRCASRRSAPQLKREPLGAMRHSLLRSLVMRRAWLGALAVSSACSDGARQEHAPVHLPGLRSNVTDTALPAIDTAAAAAAVPADTALGRCSVALQVPSGEQREVIDALKAAYGLEGTLVQRGTAPITRAEVYAHYRQGFSDALAKELTDYSWDGGGGLRETERALTIPESVGVVELTQDRALVAWIPPTALRERWGAGRCVVDRLVREDGRWIVQGQAP